MESSITYNSILCRYGEIALKKQNRKRFETQLVDNVKHALRAFTGFRVKRVFGRMFVHRRDFEPILDHEVGPVGDALSKVFGLTSVSFGIQVESEEELSDTAGRLREAGRKVIDEPGTVCCYHRSEKAWVADPQNLLWETFLTVGEATEYGEDNPELDALCCNS